MENKQIITDELMEIRKHGDISFPFRIYDEYNPQNLNFFPMHWHKQYEINIVLKGIVEFIINNNKIILSENEAIFINSNTLHQASIISNDAEWIAIVFSPKLIYGYNESIIKFKNIDNFTSPGIIINDDQTIKIIKEIINNYKSNSNLKELTIVSNLINIFINILNSNSNHLEEKNNISYIRIKKALDYIYKNYTNKITINDLVKEVNMCRTELTKLFKESLGYTITEYILRYRIEQSLPLIRSNTLNMTQISETVGFNSSSYFAEAFNTVMKMTPSQYKKQLKL